MLNVYILEDHPVELAQIDRCVRHVDQQLKLNAEIQSFSTIEQITKALPPASIHNVYLLDLVIGDDEQAGLKLSRRIRQYDLTASIIFLTAHDELLPTTYRYQVEALDFIVKDPAKVEESLLRDFSRVVSKIELPRQGKTLALRSHYDIVNVPVNDILFFQSDPHNTHGSFLYTMSNQKQPINMSLRELEDQTKTLFRVHRSYLVNLSNIRSFNVKKHIISFTMGPLTVPVSRLRTRKLIEAIRNHSAIQWQ